MAKEPADPIDPIKQAFARVANTDDGKTVLRWFHDMSGYARSIGTINRDGEINVKAMIHDIAQRGLYLQARELIPFDDRIKIENYQPPVVPTPEPQEQEDKDKLCHQKRTEALEQERQERQQEQTKLQSHKLELLP